MVMQMRKPINRLKHRCRCAFAILLSIPFIFNCFGFTAVAEDFASAPIEPSEPFDEIIISEEVFSEELEEPPEEIEFPLEPESLSGEEILSPTEEPEEQWLLDEELSADEPDFEEASDVSFQEDVSLQLKETVEGDIVNEKHTDDEEGKAESAGAVNALIECGEMLFSCHEQNTEQGVPFYWACDDGSNIVTVTNTSETTPIRACYSYEPNMDGFCAPLYAFRSAEEAEAAGREMTLGYFDAHNLAEGFTGDVIAPGETETWYVIFTEAPDVARALSAVDYLSVGRLSATVVPAG